MKRILFFLCAAVFFSGAAVFSIANFVNADPIAVEKPFHFRDNRSANTALQGSGERLTYGAHDVIPNGDHGTTGSATQGLTTTVLQFEPFSVQPNQFDWAVPYNSNLTGAWTLTFTNGTDTTTIQTPIVGDAPQLPFAARVAISGSGATPTFTWEFPADFTPNGIRIQIWDLENRLPSGIADIIHARNLAGDVTSYTVPSPLSSGKTLQQGHLYSLEISFALTHGGIPLGDNTTLLSRSRSFFDFIPLPEDSPPNVFLPIVTPGPVPVYTFDVPDIPEGQTIFIDPAVAVGYEYAIGTGNPNFASVTLPTGIGNNWYELYLSNGTKYYFKTFLKGGVPYSFPSGGVNRFIIRGIERESGLDPNNPTAFITGLTFTGGGNFTGTMTPITACFNPSVAGSGWMQSPEGAYPENPASNGYAIFSLVSKIRKGSMVPWGNAGFVFPIGHLWFHSDKYESLESNLTGTEVQLKGTGTINGSGGYSFIISAGDKSKMWGEDTFRIQIWETATGNVAYDNEANQKIAGGLIQIFKEWHSCQ